MAKKKFRVVFAVVIDIDVEESVIAEATSADWAESFYTFDEDQAVEHIAYNMGRGVGLTSLDGFAHLDHDDATLAKEEWDVQRVTHAE